MLYNHNHYQVSELFITPKENPVPTGRSRTILPSLLPLVATKLLPVSDFLTVTISYKWNQNNMCPLCLVSFTWRDVFEVHPCYGIYQYFIFFFSWQNTTSLYGYTTISHLSVDGYLGYLHLLVIVNSAGMTSHV